MKRISMQKLMRLAREERGSELVEFAMTALLLMGLLFAMIEFMLAMYTYHYVSAAAQEGVRFAVVRGATWSQDLTNQSYYCGTSATNFTMVYDCTAQASDIQNYVQSLATLGINPNNVTIDTNTSDIWSGTMPNGTLCFPANAQGCPVKVKVSYNFNFLPFQHISTLSMSATAQGIILQ